MKKTLMLTALICFASVVCAINVNVMTASGEVVTGVLIGSDENALFVKTADGNAKTLKYGKISKIFDADTAKDITDRYKTAEPSKASAEVSKQKKPSGPSAEYETVEQSSGTINLRENTTIFTRTVPKYFGLGVAIMQGTMIFGDNKRLKRLLKPYYYNSGGYTYDDGNLMGSFGLNTYAYIRPIDGFAFGGFYSINFANQNLSVHSGYSGGESKFMYIDLPVSAYGGLVRFIPYSTARNGYDGELAEDFVMSFDFKFGAAALGTPFSNASINNEAAVGDVVDLSGTAPYFAVEMTFGSQMDIMQFGIGYEQSTFTEIKATAPYPLITGADNVVMDGEGKVPFSAQGVYAYLALAF